MNVYITTQNGKKKKTLWNTVLFYLGVNTTGWITTVPTSLYKPVPNCLSLSYLSVVKENYPLLSLLSVITCLSVLTCPVRSEAQTVSIWGIITRFILLRGHYEITIRLTIFFWVWVSLQSSSFAGLLFLSLYVSVCLVSSPLVSQMCQVTCSCLTTCKIRCPL